MPLSSFSPEVRAWFEGAFDAPTPAQAQAWPAIARGEHVLLSAPTGSGKTLAAFLWGLDRLARDPLPEGERRTRLVYVSPLKALSYDIERNLRAPLTGIRLTAERLGEALPGGLANGVHQLGAGVANRLVLGNATHPGRDQIRSPRDQDARKGEDGQQNQRPHRLSLAWR